MLALMLQVELQRLRALPGAEAEAALEKLASLRSVLLGLPIRCGIKPMPLQRQIDDACMLQYV